MRIGWATPFNTRSAIGRFSQVVCAEMASRGHEIEIIRIERGAELELDGLPSACRITDTVSSHVNDYDALIVNFGNHAPYHAGLLDLIAERAPIAIFHDAEMRDFEWGMLHTHDIAIPLAPGIYDEQLASDEQDLVDPFARPLLGTLAAMSCGAVIHGPHYRSTVQAYCSGPVQDIPLCYPDLRGNRPALKLTSGRRVVIFGVISEHKQPQRVIHALAAALGRTGEIELHLAGAIEDGYRDKLISEAATLGLKPPVFHGYLPDEALQNLLDDAHAICCLRYPVTEGGSASLITAMYSGRPLILSDVASYSLVPDELAYKVPYGNEIEDLSSALVEIFKNPRDAEARASRAKLWATDRYSAQFYCDALEPFLLSIGPHATLARLASRFVEALPKPAFGSMSVALSAASEVLDWMQASQKRV